MAAKKEDRPKNAGAGRSRPDYKYQTQVRPQNSIGYRPKPNEINFNKYLYPS